MNTVFKNIIVIILSFCGHLAFSATYYTTGTGDWLTQSKWSTDTNGVGILFSTLTIVSGDIIVIDDDTDITSAEVNLSGVDITIILDAQLDIGKKLRLSANSTIEFTSNGFLNPTGPGNSEKISFGGVNVWTGNDGPFSGPGTMDENFDPATGLPIELTSFTANLNFDNVQLNWITAKEENFSHFEIERSLDQKNFETLGTVQGLGESLADAHYDFTDDKAPYGKLYYRLKAVDNDGSYEYSEIISIKKSLEGMINISPNPAGLVDKVKINLPSEFKGNIAKISLYDLNGLLIQEAYDVEANNPFEINKSLKAGMYIFKVQHNGLEENIRLIIK